MTDYPSIKPEDVREGDVVLARFDAAAYPATIEGVVGPSMRNDDDRLYVGGYVVSGATDLRLVSRPTPPEPPVWVGDWVRDMPGIEFQLTDPRLLGASPSWRASLTRIEPPVGWPVGVPTEDGGTRWYYRAGHTGMTYRLIGGALDFASPSWADLLAAGGVPALAVTR